MSLRASLDANVLIAGVRVPRWPYEVMRAGAGGVYQLILLEQVIVEARRNVSGEESDRLERFLAATQFELVEMPTQLPADAFSLIRDETDVPIAYALLGADVPMFVSSDRDFTERTATSPTFQSRVGVMLPAVFLRDACGWTSDELESVRHRTWADIGG